MGNRKIHSNEKNKIISMIANDCSENEIHRVLGVSRDTVSNYKDKYHTEIASIKKQISELAGEYATKGWREANKRDLSTLSTAQLVTTSAIATDKHLLSAGEPTENLQLSKKIVIIQSGTGAERNPGYKTIEDVLKERQKPVSVGDTNTNNNNITNVH